MEDLGLIDPSLAGGGNRRHGKNHFGEFLIQSKGELADEVELVFSPGFHGQVLKIGDVSLEPVVGRAVLLLEGSLSEGAELVVGGDLSVEQIEGGFEVVDELVERLFGVGDVGIGHPVIPSFCVRGTSSSAHLVQGGHDLGGVRGIQGGV